MISIDMPAGPSEVLVIADKHASPVHIAADLLSQVFAHLRNSCFRLYAIQLLRQCIRISLVISSMDSYL